MNDPVAGATPAVASLSTVSSVTGTVPTLPAGAVTVTVVLEPDASVPDDCDTVYIGGERCWFHDGCYYRRCGHGYTKWHGKDGGHGKGPA